MTPEDFQRLSRARIEELGAAWRGAPIAVVGDVMTDRYLWGRVARVSPEAPVPIVEVSAETIRLGGAANVARTVAALGARPRLVGVVGDDAEGEALLAEILAMGIGGEGLVVDPARPTTVKTRIVAHNQHVVRADRETRAPLASPVRARVLAALRAALDGARALLVSDYAKGVVGLDLLSILLDEARRRSVPVFADPKEAVLVALDGAEGVSVNEGRAAIVSGRSVTDENAEEIARALRARIGCRALLLTRGAHGMCLVDGDGAAARIGTLAREVYDVTGAGDTVVGTLTVARTGGASFREAALLANHAAGLVVGEVGTASASLDRLIASCEEGATPREDGGGQGPLEDYFTRASGAGRRRA